MKHDISGGAVDTLHKLFWFGAMGPGDLPSKSGEIELISLGYARRVKHDRAPGELGKNPVTVLTPNGTAYALAYFRVATFYGALKSPRGLALRLLELPHHYAKLGSHECNVITVDALMRELEFMPEPDPAAGCVSPAVFAAILRVARVNRDLRDFDGDKRGIMESAEDAEESLISLICKDPALLELVDAGE